MKDIFKFLFVVAWLTAVCTMTAAREYFRVIDSRMGLPDNTVTDIVQDARGYIWLGTSNGMCRYDGVTFTTFRHNPDDDTSLSSSFVNALAVDKAGIFAGTNSCLDLYSFSTGKFVHCFYEEGARRSRISQSIQSVVSVAGRTFYADASGGLYANRSGDICTFRRVARNFRAYSLVGMKAICCWLPVLTGYACLRQAAAWLRSALTSLAVRLRNSTYHTYPITIQPM